MNFWSISSGFIFVARCASRYWNVGQVNTWSERVDREVLELLDLPDVVGARHEQLAEGARVDESQVAPLLEREDDVGVRRRAPRGPFPAGTVRSSRSATTSTSPESSVQQQVLAPALDLA